MSDLPSISVYVLEHDSGYARLGFRDGFCIVVGDVDPEWVGDFTGLSFKTIVSMCDRRGWTLSKVYG